jgi:hypothetical protein
MNLKDLQGTYPYAELLKERKTDLKDIVIANLSNECADLKNEIVYLRNQLKDNNGKG